MNRCLVVDDSRVIRRVAAKIVQDLGFDAEEAEDGRKALNACAILMPQVVLLDWEMPVMDGIAFVDQLRKMPGGSRVAVVFCTTKNDPANIREALDAGADEYIMKPFDSEIVRTKFLLLGLLG
jgi:two-component system chemotaxis response regulator CheY